MQTIYTIREASGMLKLHRNTVFNMIQDGRITAVKLGNKYIITETELKRLIDGK